MAGMLTVQEALRLTLKAVSPLGPERVPIHEAVGRVLAQPIIARRDLPPFDNSAMDGYAVRAAEVVEGKDGLTTPLPVVDEVPAGDAGDRPLAEGACARIFTGAPMPPGADTVMIQENAERTADLVRFIRSAHPGENVRRAGSDVTEGVEILSPGRVITPGDVALLASQRLSFVQVHRRPVVAVMSSGDELVDVDGPPPGPGQIVNGNGLALAAGLTELGAIPHMLPTVRDDRAATFEALKQGARQDALLTSGGMSVGTYDFVREALTELSGQSFSFWKVGMKPGKPLGLGHIDGCAVFGLPGNPVSALVTFELFVRPALLRMMGHTRVCRPTVAARLASPLGRGGGRRDYRRAALWREGTELVVDPARNQSSGALSSIGGADALVVVPVGAPARSAGEEAQVIPLGPDAPALRVMPDEAP